MNPPFLPPQSFGASHGNHAVPSGPYGPHMPPVPKDNMPGPPPTGYSQPPPPMHQPQGMPNYPPPPTGVPPNINSRPTLPPSKGMPNSNLPPNSEHGYNPQPPQNQYSPSPDPIKSQTHPPMPPHSNSPNQLPTSFHQPTQFNENTNQLSQQMSNLSVNKPMVTPPLNQNSNINGEQKNLSTVPNPYGPPPSNNMMPPMQQPASNQPVNQMNQFNQGLTPPGYNQPNHPGMQMPPSLNHQPPHMPPSISNQPPHRPMNNQRPSHMPPMPQQASNIPPSMNPNLHMQQQMNQPANAYGHQRGPPSGQYMNGTNQRSGMPPANMGQMGYPPQPTMPSGPGHMQNSYPQQSQTQNQHMHPDQMPNPISVIMDDQAARGGIFCTNEKGHIPPLASTDFITQDQGNASPRYIRSTMYNIPIAADTLKQIALPFALVISPMARIVDQEYPPPIVDFGELGPIRCIRCKAYMCPNMQFIDSGERFQCLLCKATTEVPNQYFQHLDHTGQRIDRFERPELILGTYEFVATKEYCRNNVFPKAPAMLFLIDVSYNNVKSGLVRLLCTHMKSIIKNLPIDQGKEKSEMKVGFITYNSTVHFYNVKGSLAQPQMMVVGDVQEMFMPLLDGFLCDVEESEAVIESLMEQIPIMFGDTRETEAVLYPAIQAGLEALKASECAGKLLVFHSSLPTSEAPGKLKNRDDRNLLGTEKERTVLSPQNNVYNNLGQECVGAGCSVDLFLFNNAYIDVATIGQVSRLTGGQVYKYTYFQADVDGQRLINEVIYNVSRPIAFDAFMRVRTSTGVRPTDFYGHFFMANTTDMELASIDCDKAVAVEIKHDDKLTEEEGVYVQAVLLYTSTSGQRRIRVINLALQTCSQYPDIVKSCDVDTIFNFCVKQSTYRLLENPPKAVKDQLVQRFVQLLACYRKHCADGVPSQLILPEYLKLSPLYLNCLLKNDALSGGPDMTVDDRSFIMQLVMTMDVPFSLNFIYPRLIPIHDINPQETKIPTQMRCSIDRMVDNGAYILENGIHMFLWVGLNISSEWIQSVFGVPSISQANFEIPSLPQLENPLSIRIRTLIETIRTQKRRQMRLTLVRQCDKLENVFKHFLVEDRGMHGSLSYVEFLVHIYQEIRNFLR